MSCTICSEEYGNTDNICSTDCGHIYHFDCLQEWLTRSLRCPICNAENPKTHKIHLDLEERYGLELEKTRLRENLVEIDEAVMKLKIDSSVAEKQTEDQLNYLTLQNESREKQNDKLKMENFTLLEEIDSLTETIEFLVKTNESLTNRNNYLTLENAKKEERIKNLIDANIFHTMVANGNKN